MVQQDSDGSAIQLLNHLENLQPCPSPDVGEGEFGFSPDELKGA
jgi:hypothetical protein